MKKKREKGKHKNKGKLAVNKYLSIITLNVNGLNAPIKRHRVAEWIRKHDLHICCLQETHLRTKDKHRIKIKGYKRYFIQIKMKKRLGQQYLYLTK